MAAMTLFHSVLRMCPSLNPRGHFFEHPRSPCNPAHLLLGPCFFPRRLSLEGDRNCRNRTLFPSLTSPCLPSRSSSDQLSTLATAISCSLSLDSLIGDSSSPTVDVPTSSCLTRTQIWDSYKSATVLGGLSLVACSFLFPEMALAGATDSSFPNVMTFAGAEPSNALSLPTWLIHVASVAEWVAAMTLVWKYGDTDGNSAWKGLSWGMVPLLGGAMCACTWHFFYNAESLEVLVVLQAFLTVLGNFTLWAAAYRIWKLSQEKGAAE